MSYDMTDWIKKNSTYTICDWFKDRPAVIKRWINGIDEGSKFFAFFLFLFMTCLGLVKLMKEFLFPLIDWT